MYPSDARPGYASGRLRMLYEVFPIALIMEQAGGGATDGVNRILDSYVNSLHQRSPLVFGSQEKVRRVARYYTQPPKGVDKFPLFSKRQLLREG